MKNAEKCYIGFPLSPSGASRPCCSRQSRAPLSCNCFAPPGAPLLLAPLGPPGSSVGPPRGSSWFVPFRVVPCCGSVSRLPAPATRVALFPFLGCGSVACPLPLRVWWRGFCLCVAPSAALRLSLRPAACSSRSPCALREGLYL